MRTWPLPAGDERRLSLSKNDPDAPTAAPQAAGPVSPAGMLQYQAATLYTGIVMVAKDDWRLRNQERYLKGASLYRLQYEPASEQNDHDHCEFCITKFMRAGTPDVLHEGYATQDRYRWICPTCFDDFREMFGWTAAL
jgi:hypothetical protein